MNKVKNYYCMDISSKMLKICESKLKNYTNVKYILLENNTINNKPPNLLNSLNNKLNINCKNSIDFIFGFDAFVHIDLHTQFSYYKNIFDLLKYNKYCFIHTSNLFSKKGWKRFIKQSNYTVQGFYFITPQILNNLLIRIGFVIIKHSNESLIYQKNNLYFDRDYMIIARKHHSIHLLTKLINCFQEEIVK